MRTEKSLGYFSVIINIPPLGLWIMKAYIQRHHWTQVTRFLKSHYFCPCSGSMALFSNVFGFLSHHFKFILEGCELASIVWLRRIPGRRRKSRIVLGKRRVGWSISTLWSTRSRNYELKLLKQKLLGLNLLLTMILRIDQCSLHICRCHYHYNYYFYSLKGNMPSMNTENYIYLYNKTRHSYICSL